jgi:hypothetical protein
MKKNFFYTLLIIAFLINSSLLNAADKNKPSEEKSLGTAISDNTKEVKKEFTKTKEESKEAVIHDINQLKEQLPKDAREAKKELIKKSEDIKNLTIQELKEIREGLKKSIK